MINDCNPQPTIIINYVIVINVFTVVDQRRHIQKCDGYCAIIITYNIILNARVIYTIIYYIILIIYIYI